MSAHPGTELDWLEQLRQVPPCPAAVEMIREVSRKAISWTLRRKGAGDQDLEDLAQDATLRVLDRLHTFRGDSKLSTWARAVAIHVALSHLRRRKAPAISLDDLGPTLRGAAADPANQTARDELIDALHDAINSALTEKQRTAIQAMLMGVPLVVLAERMGSNPNALYKLYHDARKKLKSALESSGYSESEVRTLLAGESSSP